MRWPKDWSFSFSISPSNEHPRLISFRMDWLDLLAFQGTLQESSPTSHFKSINSSALSFLDYAKVFDCVDHNKLWEILKEMGIPDLLICLLRNLYTGQEAS